MNPINLPISGKKWHELFILIYTKIQKKYLWNKFILKEFPMFEK